jgi:polyvinyl alcohol dehydrogenase (cytochrome)
MNRTVARRLILATGLMALAIVSSEPLRGGGSPAPTEWTMIGQGVDDARSQPGESQIGPANVARLAQKWVVTITGDVSATPAVGLDGRNRRRALYFPDWGGRLWKVDAEDGTVLWSRAIASYNGIAGSLSRTSPVLARGLVFVADLNGNMMAVDAVTGDLRWLTELDPHPAAIVTTSPIHLDGHLYIALSASESRTPPACCTFRGSMVALAADTGRIEWQSFVLPDNGGRPGGYSGGAFVNPPAIDVKNGLIYAAAGQLYTQPDSVTTCLAAAAGRWSEACFARNAYFNSVVAFDLETGQIRWGFRGVGAEARQRACGSLPRSVTWCPAPDPLAAWETQSFSVWDFAGSGPNVFAASIDGRARAVVGIGQKSGVYWALDAATGEYLWSTLVGPGSDPGGIQWGTAYDGKRIYAAIGHNTLQPYALASGAVVTGGSWAALDPSSGRILWQTADPQGAPDLAALTVANGVLYGGSMAHTGDQMYALEAATGAIRWRFAAGGSVVAGPAIANGRVYWGSGYARTGGVGNNRFYAFSIDGR